jgi:hypothetical protein
MAERIELIAEPATEEDVAEEVEEALEALPAAAETSLSIESVPVSDGGDTLPAEAEEPAAGPAEEEERPAAQYNIPETHDVTGPVTNPRRGWWRR